MNKVEFEELMKDKKAHLSIIKQQLEAAYIGELMVDYVIEYRISQDGFANSLNVKAVDGFEEMVEMVICGLERNHKIQTIIDSLNEMVALCTKNLKHSVHLDYNVGIILGYAELIVMLKRFQANSEE